MVDRPNVEASTMESALETWVVVDGTEHPIAAKVNAHKHDEPYDSRSPTVSIRGETVDPDAPEPEEFGEAVTAIVRYTTDREQFSLAVQPSVASAPVQLEAVRGESPAGEFENFEAVWNLVNRAYEAID